MVRFPIHSYADHLRTQAHRGTHWAPESAKTSSQHNTPSTLPARRDPGPAPSPSGVSRLLNRPYDPRPGAPSATTVLSAWAQMSGPDGCISPW